MTFDEMYSAIIENDENYDTLFFYAVKSTGIYCRPSCKSKIPQKKNVEFFNTLDEASQAGYRPCKRCRSDLLNYQPMKEIAEKLKKLIDKMYNESKELNSEMKKIGLSHKRMVEVFKEEYGITLSGYVNDLRFNEAKRQLAMTDVDIIEVAHAVGFSSLSSFYRFFKERAKVSPAVYRKENKC